MHPIATKFFRTSSILATTDSEAIMDFLTQPESVNLMLCATQMGLPALAGVVAELEDRFAHCRDFALDHEGEDSNAPHRRNIGWMVRHVMKAYGYTPVKGMQLHERTRLGRFSEYFGTSALYQKTIQNPAHRIEVQSIP